MPSPEPLFLFDLLRGLGNGGEVVAIGTAVLAVYYLFRGRYVARTIVGVFGTVWLVAISVSTGVGVALFFGWLDPNPAAIESDVATGIRVVTEIVSEPVGEWVRSATSGVITGP